MKSQKDSFRHSRGPKVVFQSNHKKSNVGPGYDNATDLSTGTQRRKREAEERRRRRKERRRERREKALAEEKSPIE